MNVIAARATATILATAGILLLLLVWALQPQPTQGVTGTNDPAPGQVFQVAVDTDTAGNPFGSGGLLSSIQSTTPNITLGTTRDIDVIVDEVDPGDGMSGFSLNLKFDPAIVTIVFKNHNSFMLAGGFEIAPPPIPNTTGNLRMDVAWIGGNVSGEGVLVRFTVLCMANGVSVLDLDDDIGADGIPDILDGVNFGAPLNVLNAVDGEINCGTGATPSPSPTVTASPTATATASPTATATASPTATATASPTATATASPTATATASPTALAGTQTPSATDTTPTPSPTPLPATATPGDLPPTGGGPADASASIVWLFVLLAGIGALLLLAGGTGLLAARGPND